MKCDKCNQEFEEKDLQLSHDIPKYLGGTDNDGRHWLCKICHDAYEYEVLKLVLMNWIKNLPTSEKNKLKIYAEIVKKYFFKNG